MPEHKSIWANRIVGYRQVDPKAIAANPDNIREHGAEQTVALEALLTDVGILQAVIVNLRSSPKWKKLRNKQTLVDGHLRMARAIECGVKKIPAIIVDLDPREEKVALATFDPIGELATVCAESLQRLSKELETDEPALLQLVEDLSLQTLNSQELFGDNDEATQDRRDNVPEIGQPDKARTRLGDLWILGEHRLLCGDSAKAEDVDRLLGGERIHLVNTDPPYNVKVEPRSNNAISAGLSSYTKPAAAKKKQTHHQRFDVKRHPEKAKPTQKTLRAKDRPLENDFVSDEEFDRLLEAWFGNIARVLIGGGAFYIWGGYANCSNYPPVLKRSELYFSQAIIWDKQHPVLTRKDFMGNHEWCFYGWREGAAHRFFGPKNVPDVWAIKKVNPQSMIHLTEKPVELAARSIGYSSRVGDNVLDLFGGSGSTLIACEEAKRRGFLMELDPLYCDVIVKRWEQFTKRKAKREPARQPAKRRRTRKSAK